MYFQLSLNSRIILSLQFYSILDKIKISPQKSWLYSMLRWNSKVALSWHGQWYYLPISFKFLVQTKEGWIENAQSERILPNCASQTATFHTVEKLTTRLIYCRYITLLKYGFCNKSFRKDETLTSWTQVEHFFNIFVIKIRFYSNQNIGEGESNFDDKYVE